MIDFDFVVIGVYSDFTLVLQGLVNYFLLCVLPFKSKQSGESSCNRSLKAAKGRASL
jgi:hypothetical protein